MGEGAAGADERAGDRAPQRLGQKLVIVAAPEPVPVKEREQHRLGAHLDLDQRDQQRRRALVKPVEDRVADDDADDARREQTGDQRDGEVPAMK